MIKRQATQSNVKKDELRKDLEQLTMQEQQAERDLRQVQNQIKQLGKAS